MMRARLGSRLLVAVVALACCTTRAGAGETTMPEPAATAAAESLAVPHAATAPARPDGATPWALVLSGGIARGFAHAGVIKALEEERVRPDLVVGSSMGGLVGAMYSAGMSADSIRRVCERIPWEIVFTGGANRAEWRGLWPKPWIELVSDGGGSFQIPAAIVDNTIIDYVLADLFLDADAQAQGDFDRLPIPFRTIGTDVRTGRWVMLDHGSLARACRITSGLPLMFPPVAEGDALLVDGGMSSNLPISPARAAGARRVLAVDVALPYPELDESSSGLEVFLQLWDILNKRGQNDTVSVAAGDTLMWLKLPGAPAAAFAEAPSIIDQGYAEGGAATRSWARRSGLPRTDVPLVAPDPLMPPLASRIEWQSPRPVARVGTARHALGRLPEGPFHPGELRPALRRLAQSGLFESAWPGFRVVGDSTVLSFDVRERPTLALGPAFAAGNDEGARAYLGLTYRPVSGPLPAIVKLGGSVHTLGGAVQASFEPVALDYGSAGWFVRARHHHLQRRVYQDQVEVDRIGNTRDEVFLGGQVSRVLVQTLAAGIGWARTRTDGVTASGAVFAFETRAHGRDQRTVHFDRAMGPDRYARFEVNLTHDLRFAHSFAITPGLRFGTVDRTPPPDALVGLGGPHSMSGLHADEWLGRRMWAGSVEFALEASRQARLYVATQVGKVEHVVSGSDLGATPRVGFGIGGEIESPVGPVRLEWGTVGHHHDRWDVMVGPRF